VSCCGLLYEVVRSDDRGNDQTLILGRRVFPFIFNIEHLGCGYFGVGSKKAGLQAEKRNVPTALRSH
jgi:hypothetical protein